MSAPESPAILLIHGAGGGGWEWRAWSRVFAAAGFQVHAPDLVAGPGGTAGTRFDDYRNQVVDYGRALGGPLVLAGASLGGLLALAARGLEPAARILVNPVPPAGTPGWPPAVREWPEVVAWGDAPDFEGTRRAMPDCGHAARLQAHARWRNESGRVMAAIHRGINLDPEPAPTLVFGAERDGDVPPDVSRALARRYAWDFVLVPGASHLGPLLGHAATRCASMARDWLGLQGRHSFSFDSEAPP